MDSGDELLQCVVCRKWVDESECGAHGRGTAPIRIGGAGTICPWHFDIGARPRISERHWHSVNHNALAALWSRTEVSTVDDELLMAMFRPQHVAGEPDLPDAALCQQLRMERVGTCGPLLVYVGSIGDSSDAMTFARRHIRERVEPPTRPRYEPW